MDKLSRSILIIFLVILLIGIVSIGSFVVILLLKSGNGPETSQTQVLKVTSQQQLSNTITQEEAIDFLQKFVQLEENLDPAMFALYMPTSKIIIKREYPFGEERILEMSGEQYINLGKAALPLARARGDRNEYSDLSILLKMKRYSFIKQETYDHELTIRKDVNGIIKIIEERGQSNP